MTYILELLKEYDNSNKVLKAGNICFIYLKDLCKTNNFNVNIELNLNLDDFTIMLPGEIQISECSVRIDL